MFIRGNAHNGNGKGCTPLSIPCQPSHPKTLGRSSTFQTCHFQAGGKTGRDPYQPLEKQ